MRLSTQRLVIAFLFFSSVKIWSQTFTWIRGSNTISPAGQYGTKTVASATNDPGGRHGSATWVDKNGNMWLLGGEGHALSTSSTCWLNDLWKYQPALNQWTWMHGDSTCDSYGNYGTLGIPSSTNAPGGREFSQCWTDTAGNFWLFGGFGYASSGSIGQMNDLWKFNPAANQWTWVHGSNLISQNGIYGTQGSPSPSNVPGARQAGATWTGNDGHLYLWGGRGFPASGSAHFLNDLWRYNISTNQWTWLHGTNLTAQTGIFGTKGTPAPGNMPGGKEFPATWKDASGTLYLFGGRGAGYFNDLWKYDVTTNNWTWLHGANVANQKGLYGTMGVPTATTVPGGRLNNGGWVDKAGDLWLFGGQGWSATTLNLLNDLWRYDPCSNEWTWMKGSDTTNRYGNYGTLNQAATTNLPGSRMYINPWTDMKGQPWFTGGEGFDAASIPIGHMNDVWNLELPKRSDSIYTAQRTVCSGNSATLSVNTTFTTVLWYHFGSQTPIGSGTTFISPALTAVNPTTVSYLALINCPAKPKSAFTISIQPLPSLNVLATSTSICRSSSTTLWFTGAASYSIGGAATTSSIIVSPSISTTYSVTGIDSVGCVNGTTVNIIVSLCVGEGETNSKENDVFIYPNPADELLYITHSQNNSTLTIYDLKGALLLQEPLVENKSTIPLSLLPGVYICVIESKNNKITKKLIIK